jgi:hypothetical protein
MQQTKPQDQPTPPARLHAAYTKLTFRCFSTSDQDARRERLFQRLVLHHLLQHNMYTHFDWHNPKAQQECLYNFLQAYAKQLWPGKKAARSHLSNPELQPFQTRGFIGAIDGHWAARRNGGKVASFAANSNRGKESEGIDEAQRAYDQYSPIGNMAYSRVGKALAQYVGVLLEPGLENAEVEDVELLIEGIASVEMGPDVPARVVQDVMVKIEDESD